MRLTLGVVTLSSALMSLSAAASLPIVDLGYELHQANPFSLSQGIYNFSNIRYAAPPLGDLRFRAPVPPQVNRSEIQDGTIGRVCPQATPLWESIATTFVETQLLGLPYTGPLDINASSYPVTPQDPRTTEDCLFLDVVVPQRLFHKAQNGSHYEKAPVLVWIFGGGYTSGDKSAHDPSGLIRRSKEGGKDGIVYVALNYRLGAFGFLGGDSIKENGTANAALHDQRLALGWVYKYIHLFGGDPENITVMGQSAGAGCIMHQITAYGGNYGQSPFQKAIVQSPGWVPLPDEEQQETTLQQFLGIANVNTIEEARNLPTEKLIAANLYQVGVKSLYGTFTYSPVVDGTFVPALPGQLLQSGNFDRNLQIMVGHNADEGLDFTSPISLNESGFAAYLKQGLPEISPEVLNEVTEVLYPPVFNGTYGYTTDVQRLALAVSDLVFQCNTAYLNRAYNQQTYAYLFSIPPALHGQDLPYTFFSGSNSTSLNTTVAIAMQQYITSFVQTGIPKSSIGPIFHKHGARSNIMDFSNSGISEILDTTDNARCRFWQSAPYA